MKVDPSTLRFGFEFEFVMPMRNRRHVNTYKDELRDSLEGAGLQVGERSRNDYSQYQITEDGSISADGDNNDYGYVGMEIVSPVFDLEDAFDQFSKVSNVVNELGGYTNRTTGCHWGISASRVESDLLLALFPVFMNNWARLKEDSVLKRWDRVDNDYSRSCYDYIPMFVRTFSDANGFVGYINPKTYASRVNMRSVVYHTLRLMPRMARYFTLSPRVSPVAENLRYVECRAMGNSDYEHRKDDILTTLNDYIEVMEYTMAGNGREEFLSMMIDQTTPLKRRWGTMCDPAMDVLMEAYTNTDWYI